MKIKRISVVKFLNKTRVNSYIINISNNYFMLQDMSVHIGILKLPRENIHYSSRCIIIMTHPV